MALTNDFYSDIFTQEQKWIELMNSKLLNSIYCNLVLRPFYIEKKEELKKEFALTNNKLIGQIINIVDSIISQIDILNQQYKNNQTPDIKSLFPFFLTVQMSNEFGKTNNDEINKLQIKKQILENQLRSYDRGLIVGPDYIYDDFPEEIKSIKR